MSEYEGGGAARPAPCKGKWYCFHDWKLRIYIGMGVWWACEKCGKTEINED